MTNKEFTEKLFNSYSAQLSALPQYGEGVPQLHDSFVCPICLDVFDRADLESGLLSLEHAIPAALGGTLATATMTCRRCNNTGGAEIDSHLVAKIRSEDFLGGKSSEQNRIWTNVHGHPMRASLQILERDGKKHFKVYFDRKNSNPHQFDAGLRALSDGVARGAESSIEFKISVPLHRLRAKVALLRIGYLMMFRQFGYGYLLHENLVPIREQLQNPHIESISELNTPNLELPTRLVNSVGLISLPGDQQGFIVGVRLQVKDRVGGVAQREVRHRTIGILMPGLGEPDNIVYQRIRDAGAMGKALTSKIRFLDYHPDRIADPAWIPAPLEFWERFKKVRSCQA